MENHSIKDLETYKKLVEKCLRENYNPFREWPCLT